jgi:hypothetical protein
MADGPRFAIVGPWPDYELPNYFIVDVSKCERFHDRMAAVLRKDELEKEAASK